MSLDPADERAKAFLEGAAGVVAAVAGAQREFEQRFAPAFNPVALLVSRREAAWSDLLAMLLKPDGPHGQGSLFLDAFCRTAKIDSRPSGLVSVVREAPLADSRRADILLTWSGPSPFACLIENKIDATDQDAQLRSYTEYLQARFADRWVVVYVSLWGEPSERSISKGEGARLEKEGRFILLSYREGPSIAAWLADMRRACMAERVRVFLDWMEEAIEIMIGSANTIDPTLGALASYIASSPSNVELAQRVKDALPHVRSTLPCRLAEVIVARVTEKCPGLSKGRDSLLHDWSKGYESFVEFRHPTWPEPVWLSLSAAPKGASWLFGISYDKQNALTESDRSALFDRVVARLGRAASDSWWAWKDDLPAPITDPSSPEGLMACAAVINARAGIAPKAAHQAALDACEHVVDAFVTLTEVLDVWTVERRGTAPPADQAMAR